MYVVIEIQTSGNAVSNFVWSYANENEAFSKYHNVLSAAAVSSLPSHAAVILNSDGLQIAAQAFHHDVE